MNGQHAGRRSTLAFSAYCVLAAFGTYFCVYAFRKPFTAATFEGHALGELPLKALYVSTQVAGYTLSKFIGIRVVSSMPAAQRAAALLGLVAVAEASLLMFGLTPAPWNAVWLFVNGLPLGMTFGLILGFLEGRRQTEALTAGLCASFVLSSGVVKSVGRTLVTDHHVSEFWMPAAVGAVFAVPLVIFVTMLSRIPPPNAADEERRAPRDVMTRDERRGFFRRHAVGLTGLVAVYLLLTVGRSLRDDYAVEIWGELDSSQGPSVYARTELAASFLVLVACGATAVIRDNRRAFSTSLWLSTAGLACLALSVVMVRCNGIGAFGFMVLSGIGLYVPYAMFHTTVFERLIAVFRERANLGYPMYLADAFGYLGYVGVLVVNSLVGERSETRSLDLFFTVCLTISIGSVLALSLIGLHFGRRTRGAVDATSA